MLAPRQQYFVLLLSKHQMYLHRVMLELHSPISYYCYYLGMYLTCGLTRWEVILVECTGGRLHGWVRSNGRGGDLSAAR